MELNEVMQQIFKPEITVKLKDQFGVQTIVPVCRGAQLFADIAGTKTLTKPAIAAIKSLGYFVKVQMEEVVL